MVSKNISTLYSWDLTRIEASTANAINARSGQSVALSGVKINCLFQNFNAEPMWVRMWVVSFKGIDQLALPQDTADNPIVQDNFYSGQGAIRAVDYNGVSRGAFDHMVHSINKDAYNVLWSKTFMVQGRGGEGVYEPSIGTKGIYPNPDRNYKFIRKYVKCHRTITYDTDSPVEVPTNGRIFLIYHAQNLWRGPAGAQIENLKVSEHHLVYWRDPK